MISILFLIAAAASIITAIIGLSFLVSCIWEKEGRASLFAGFQFVLMLGLAILLFYLESIGLFETRAGTTILILSLIPAAGLLILLTIRFGLNPQALQGTRGLMVGSVSRYDERDIVFARNRALRPESEQYNTYYKLHPEYEEYDAARRKKAAPWASPARSINPKTGPMWLPPWLRCQYLCIFQRQRNSIRPNILNSVNSASRLVLNRQAPE